MSPAFGDPTFGRGWGRGATGNQVVAVRAATAVIGARVAAGTERFPLHARQVNRLHRGTRL